MKKMFFTTIIKIIFYLSISAQTFAPNELEWGIMINFPNDFIKKLYSLNFIKEYDGSIENIMVANFYGLYDENGKRIIRVLITGVISGEFDDLKSIGVTYNKEAKEDFQKTYFVLSSSSHYKKGTTISTKDGDDIEVFYSTRNNEECYFAFCTRTDNTGEKYYTIEVMNKEAYKEFLVRETK